MSVCLEHVFPSPSCFALLSLNPYLSLKALLSGLWKPAAVGVPIRAPQRGKVNFTKGVRSLRHHYQMMYGSFLCCISLTISQGEPQRDVYRYSFLSYTFWHLLFNYDLPNVRTYSTASSHMASLVTITFE